MTAERKTIMNAKTSRIGEVRGEISTFLCTGSLQKVVHRKHAAEAVVLFRVVMFTYIQVKAFAEPLIPGYAWFKTVP